MYFSTASMSADSSAGPRASSGDSGLTGNLSGNSTGSRAPTSCSTGGEDDHHILKNRANIHHIAPPLPLHRYPSWEDRIYQVASEAGILDSNETTTPKAFMRGLSEETTSAGDSTNNNNQMFSPEDRIIDQYLPNEDEEGRNTNNRLSTASMRGSIGFGSDVSVPVYASVKGVSISPTFYIEYLKRLFY